MRRTILILIAALSFSQGIFPQSLSSFLPSKAASKAMRLLASIQEMGSAIEARLKSQSKAELSAESDAVTAYALLASSSSSQVAWAKSDGSLKSAEAKTAYLNARAAAKAAAETLAVEDGDIATLQSQLKAEEDSLAALVLASGAGEKASIGLGRALAAASKDQGRLFPEIAEILARLQGSGAEGARLAASAMAYRAAEGQGRSLVAARAKILELAPASELLMGRLEAALTAYRAWIGCAPLAAFPGDLGSIQADARASLTSSIAALVSLGVARATELLAAMSLGDARELAASQAAERLAFIWNGSPAPLRRELAGLCGSSESAMTIFAMAGDPSISPSGAASPITATMDPIAALTALDSLEIAIADDESRAGVSASTAEAMGVEPALLFLERPELEAIASREPRFSGLYAEASRRLAGLYVQATEGAQEALESSGAVAKAAALALGSDPASLAVRAVDLEVPDGDSGRLVSFYAVATDAGGLAISLPVSADWAGVAYAAAFAKAAGLAQTPRASTFEGSSLLARYGQVIVAAYDPEGSKAAYTIASLPDGKGPPAISDAELEYALLGGWQP
jgi:hypothetical protein